MQVVFLKLLHPLTSMQVIRILLDRLRMIDHKEII